MKQKTNQRSTGEKKMEFKKNRPVMRKKEEKTFFPHLVNRHIFNSKICLGGFPIRPPFI
jgi:hypothetical protein